MSHVEFNVTESSSERRPSATSTGHDAPSPAKRMRFSRPGTPAPPPARTQQLLTTAAFAHSMVPPTRAPIAWSQSEQLLMLPVPGGVLLRTLPRDTSSQQPQRPSSSPASQSHLLRSVHFAHPPPTPRPTLISISPSSRVILAAFPHSVGSLRHIVTDEHICLWLRGPSGALNDWTEIHLPWAAHLRSTLRHVAWCDAPRQWHHAGTDTAESQKLRVNGQAMPFTRAAAGGARLPAGAAATKHAHGAEAAVLFGDAGDVSLIYRTSVTTPFVTIRTTLASAELALAPSMGLFTEVPQDCTFLGPARIEALAVGAVPDEPTLLVAYTVKEDSAMCFSDFEEPSAGKATMSAAPKDKPPPPKNKQVAPAMPVTNVSAGAERSFIRLCEVRVGLGLGADGSGVFVSTRPLAPVPVAPPGSGRALKLPTHLCWRAAPRYDTPDGSSMLRLIASFSLPPVPEEGSDATEGAQAQLRTWEVSRVYSPLSNAFSSLESKRAMLPASTLEWVVRSAASRLVRGASVTCFASSTKPDAFGAILEETDEDGKPCWASWMLYDVASLEALHAVGGKLPLGTQYSDIVLSPNGTLAAGFDLRGTSARLDIFPAPRRVPDGATPTEQAGRDLALSLLRGTGPADVARVHLRDANAQQIKEALLQAAKILGLTAPSLHEALKLLQLNAALWQHEAERVRVVLELARASQAFRAAELSRPVQASGAAVTSAGFRIASLGKLVTMLKWLLALLDSLVRDAILLDATHDLPTPPAAPEDAGPPAAPPTSPVFPTGSLLALFTLRTPRLLLVDALSRALSLCLWLRETSDEARRAAVLADRAQVRSAAAAAEAAEMGTLLPSEELDLARARADDAISACAVDLKVALGNVRGWQSGLTHDPNWWATPGLSTPTSEETTSASRALAHVLLGQAASHPQSCVRDALALLVSADDVLGEADALAPARKPQAAAARGRGAERRCAACGAKDLGNGALDCVCGGAWWIA